MNKRTEELVRKLIQQIVKEEFAARKAPAADVIGDEVPEAPVMTSEMPEDDQDLDEVIPKNWGKTHKTRM